MLGLLAAVLWSDVDPVSAQAGCPPRPSPPPRCASEVRLDLPAGPVLLGESMDLAVTASARCSALPDRFHLVFVLLSGADRRTPDATALRALAEDMVDSLGLLPYAETHAGVVALEDGALGAICSLGQDASSLAACLGRAEPAPGPLLAEGLELARRELRRARCHVESPELSEYIVVVTDDARDLDCGDARASARRAVREGVEIAASCVGGDCVSRCLAELITTAPPSGSQEVWWWLDGPRRPWPSPTPTRGPSPTVVPHPTSLPEGWLHDAFLALEPAPAARLDTRKPLPAGLVMHNGTIYWAHPGMSAGAEMQLPLRLTAPGRRHPFSSVRLHLLDQRNRWNILHLPTPGPILVLEPAALPSATPTHGPSPTPTASATRTPSATPTASLTPRPSPTSAPRPPGPVYLPYMKVFLDPDA